MPPLARGFYKDSDNVTPLQHPENLPSVTVEVDGEPAGHVDAATGALSIPSPDGGVVVDFEPKLPAAQKDAAVGDFYENLALKLAQTELDRIASELLPAIDSDEESRREWLETRARGIDLLGFKLEEPRGDAGSSTAPVEGMSIVRHPAFAEAVIRFQSNAAAELLPAVGPVKVRNDTPSTPANIEGTPFDQPPSPFSLPQAITHDDLAEALEKDFNHYLTVIDRGYRADTERLLFSVGFGGCGFKKVYNCPLKRRPVSRSVDAADIIVGNAIADFEDAPRITHRILMRPSLLKKMQYAGVYRKIELASPTTQLNAVEKRISENQGFNSTIQRTEDQPYTIFECYCELNIDGYEHKDKSGEPTGIPVPYRVTMDKDSRQVLEIRRNWHEDDEFCMMKKVFVKYAFVPAFGFYEVGLLQLVGNAERALTSAWRLMLDSGMFSNFPGFIYLRSAVQKQLTNEFRVPPGGGVGIDSSTQDIRAAIQPLPYKDVGNGLMMLVKEIENATQRIAGTAELQVSEGKMEAPVGTTLALIEQASKMLAAVHVRLHAAQAEEFLILKDLFREDPGAFWRHNKHPAKKWEIDEFLAALEDYDIVPAADPNIPSHMHRIMKATAVKQLQIQNPMLYDAQAVDTMILRMIGIADPNALFNKNPQPTLQPSGPPPDPAKMIKVQLEAQEMQRKAATEALEAQQRQQEMQQKTQSDGEANAARERIAAAQQVTERMRLQAEQVRHQDELARADREMQQAAQGEHVQQQHEQQMSALAYQHQLMQTASQNTFQAQAAAQDREHQLATTQMQQAHEQTQSDADREAAAAQARLAGAKKPANNGP